MTLQLVDGKFRDSRWQEGRWVLDSFKDASGSMNWDQVPSYTLLAVLGPAHRQLHMLCSARLLLHTYALHVVDMYCQDVHVDSSLLPRQVCAQTLMSLLVTAQVIDAEMARRKLLEESPIASTQEEPVLFDTSEIPWWAWVRRFHLPEVVLPQECCHSAAALQYLNCCQLVSHCHCPLHACFLHEHQSSSLHLVVQAEKINGRACMVGYALGYVVDALTGHGLVDQQNSFLGKVLLNVTVIGLLIYRNNAALPAYKNLLDEATFYDKQWQATWEGQERPSESEK